MEAEAGDVDPDQGMLRDTGSGRSQKNPTPSLWDTLTLDLSPENCDKTHFYCFGSPTLWGFVTVVLRKHVWGSHLLLSVFSREAESPCPGRSCTWTSKAALLKVIITVRNLGGGVTGVFIILMVMMNSQCLLMSKFRELSSLHVKISKSCLQIF